MGGDAVLVSGKGRVVDSTPLSGTAGESGEAEKIVSLWKFKPARWGNLDVPLECEGEGSCKA
ncbi:MAG: hypothetical protein ACRD1O_01550 [Terriglobia bacterium]